MPVPLMPLTAVILKFTGRFKEQMEKQRCTLCLIKHIIPMEDVITFQIAGSVLLDVAIIDAAIFT